MAYTLRFKPLVPHISIKRL